MHQDIARRQGTPDAGAEAAAGTDAEGNDNALVDEGPEPDQLKVERKRSWSKAV